MPSRILFVSHASEWTGPTNSLLLLLRHLRNRYDVAVLVPGEGLFSDMLTHEGITCFNLPTLDKRSVPAMVRLIRHESIDLVYGNSSHGGSRNAMLAAKMARRPIVWHFREVKWHWSWHKGVFLRGADAIVAVSQACAESIQRFYPRQIHVIYNGVELPAFGGDRSDARERLARELNLPPDTPCLLSVSHLRRRKGQEQAIEIIVQLVGQMPNAHWIVAGDHKDAAYVSRIKRIIHERGLQEHIHLLGVRTDVPRLMCGADVFLHTAVQDPHPRAVIEAMAAGLPVVAFAVDGVAETVVDDVTGHLFPLGDVSGMAQAVLSLLQTPAQAVEMGRKGRARVQSWFTAARTADQVAQVIAGLL